MKATVTRKVEIEILSVALELPVRYGDDDMPNDFPFRDGDTWTATVDIDTGEIKDWPKDIGEFHLEMKVTDSGSYSLILSDGEIVELQDYVPHGVVPGEYGGYVNLQINESGIITNWPENPDVSEFFKVEED